MVCEQRVSWIKIHPPKKSLQFGFRLGSGKWIYQQQKNCHRFLHPANPTNSTLYQGSGRVRVSNKQWVMVRIRVGCKVRGGAQHSIITFVFSRLKIIIKRIQQHNNIIQSTLVDKFHNSFNSSFLIFQIERISI